MKPVWVSWSSACARAIPKSLILGVPARSIRMLPGLMSRCTMPRSWARARALATADPISATRVGGSAPTSRIRSARLCPSTYSMTSQCESFSSTTSNTPTAWASLSEAAMRASRMARAAAAGSPGSAPICLTATSRPSTVSRHSQTVPIPPLPMERITS